MSVSMHDTMHETQKTPSYNFINTECNGNGSEFIPVVMYHHIHYGAGHKSGELTLKKENIDAY